MTAVGPIHLRPVRHEPPTYALSSRPAHAIDGGLRASGQLPPPNNFRVTCARLSGISLNVIAFFDATTLWPALRVHSSVFLSHHPALYVCHQCPAAAARNPEEGLEEHEEDKRREWLKFREAAEIIFLDSAAHTKRDNVGSCRDQVAPRRPANTMHMGYVDFADERHQPDDLIPSGGVGWAAATSPHLLGCNRPFRNDLTSSVPACSETASGGYLTRLVKDCHWHLRISLGTYYGAHNRKESVIDNSCYIEVTSYIRHCEDETFGSAHRHSASRRRKEKEARTAADHMYGRAGLRDASVNGRGEAPMEREERVAVLKRIEG
ncbi:hypothetical protein B0H14DRAFT_3146689 [Mycena olivaceomarginata]|nr:hypothetical protein B0H14DRAFT_3146689 [Mycena olivaceomarginata]